MKDRDSGSKPRTQQPGARCPATQRREDGELAAWMPAPLARTSPGRSPAGGRPRTHRAAVRAFAAGRLATALTVTALMAAACGGQPAAQRPGSPQSDSAELTACMRAHGVRNFPEATGNGQFNLNGIDTSSPRYQSALNACKLLFRSQNQNQNQAQQQAQALAQGLRYSRCMRAHGLRDFPDPAVSGGAVSVHVSSGSGIDPHSPQFTAAQRACRHVLTQAGSS